MVEKSGESDEIWNTVFEIFETSLQSERQSGTSIDKCMREFITNSSTNTPLLKKMKWKHLCTLF